MPAFMARISASAAFPGVRPGAVRRPRERLSRVRRREAGVSRALRLSKSRVGDYGASGGGCPFAAPPMAFGAAFRAAESGADTPELQSGLHIRCLRRAQ